MKDTRIDERLHDIEDEVRLLSDYIGEAVGASLDSRISELTKRIESLNVPAGDGASVVEAAIDPDVLAGLHDELRALNESIEARLTDIGTRIDAVQPSAPAPDAGEITGKLSANHDALTALRDELKTAGEAIGSRLDGLGSRMESLHDNDPGLKELADELPKHREAFSSINRGLESLEASVAHAHEAIGEAVTGGIAQTSGDINGRLESLDSRLDTLGGTLGALGEAIPAISGQIQSGSAGQADLRKNVAESIGRLEKHLEALSADFASHVETLKTKVSRNSDMVQNESQRLGQKHEESAAKLLKELQSLRENSEVIRRMCTTDEEKFLGGMTTVIFNRTNAMSAEMTKLFNSMKKWIASLDENQQYSAEKVLDRQDEIKKSLLFDITKIIETVQKIDSQVSHDRKRPIGTEIIRTSDTVAGINEIIPDIRGSVAAINEQLIQVSKEVRRMRWFVVAAVGVSIVVLAASFFV